MNIKHKMNYFWKKFHKNSIWFHIVGIIAIIWFLVRVLPKPDRIRYPCQQTAVLTATGYIAFWGILWSAMFHGVAIWVRRARTKTAKLTPFILVGLVISFSVSSMVFANTQNLIKSEPEDWTPIPNEPIGVGKGVNPGRVVWVWNPNATRSDLLGFWWLKDNNNQDVLDEMFSQGIQNLTDKQTDYDSWAAIFSYFNNVHGKGNIGYQSGEKIAIKVNLNNCWGGLGYIQKDNDRDASPYVVKALLRQLVNEYGVAQEDITVYDASRKMANWFYDRVYYEEYPSLNLVPEFPNIHYVDSTGGAEGREKVIPSDTKIYFADEVGIVRTLPTIVAEADYIINMPLLKRHPTNYGVTLSGKNFFGTWIEPVSDIHEYHQSGFTEGNPTPQTDLLADEDIGGKTVLFVGDGTFATKIDHSTIGKFEMQPFNNSWTNSLFFSQDPVAMDSVMYDFLYTEGCNPCEGSQNYLHQSAEPLENTYDPEGDGTYLSESLGIHEHWNTSVDIFSSERYHGIDYVTVGEEHAGYVKSKKTRNIFSFFDFNINDYPIILKLIKIREILRKT